MRQLRSELRAKWQELVSEQGQSGQTVTGNETVLGARLRTILDVQV